MPCSPRKVSGSPGQASLQNRLWGQRPRSKGNGTLSPFLCHWFDRGRGGCFRREFEPCSLKSPSPLDCWKKNTGHRQWAPASPSSFCHRVLCLWNSQPALVGGSGKLIRLIWRLLGDKRVLGFHRLSDRSMQFGLCHRHPCCFMFYFL